MLEYKVSQLTDIGRKRRENQDAKFVGKGYFILADGLGGRKAGKQASSIAVEIARHRLYALMYGLKKKRLRDNQIESYLKQSLNHVNNFVYLISDLKAILLEDDHEAFKDIINLYDTFGTTLAVSVIKDGSLYVANVGDSRVYLQRDGVLGQLTTDHACSWKGFGKGSLLQYIGQEKVDAATACVALEKGDRILMATDGLTDFAEDTEISNILKQSEFKSIKYALRALAYAPQKVARDYADVENVSFKKAQERIGGRDNITLILIEYTGNVGGNENE